MAPLPKTQKALQISRTGGPEVLEYNDAQVPTISTNQVLVKNTFSGVNFIDTYFRTGLYKPEPFPYTLGREGEGHIVDPGRSDFKIGDYVGYIGPDTHAQYTAADAEKVIKLPEGIEPGLAAASFIQGLTALTLIREAHLVQPGDAVLVHAAAGGVGLWLCQLLRAAGAGKIIATASTKEKLDLARENGATVLINYSEEDWVARVKEEGGVVAVFDGVGKSTFDGDIEVLRRKGSLVSFGNASGAVLPFSIARLGTKNIKLLRPSLPLYVQTREEFLTYAEELLELIAQKKVNVRIHKVYELKDGRQAQEDIEGRGTTGKLLYKIPQ